MFLEIPQSVYYKIRDLLQIYNLSYEISDCTLPNEKIKYVHLEFSCSVSEKVRALINEKIDEAYKEIRENYEKTNVAQISIEDIEKDNEAKTYENERT